ncbi:PTS sugar transporter subunit IIB [Olsenella profusa]|uniref:PTS system, lactose/cellobiose-specific IIB subunit n=1 Tax=Olsenella profusa F0195 TaxID=1125712 RepID=U2V271_9ACTN|nr:PTS sugar transporter subunit IIB [Olsenella profusa]ERL09467.1 PTS system, lactose/cellobiose-specific IIB subunit [Olsenella profusa F0195]
MAKRVLVACGNGVATSTVVASKIRDYCKERGLDVQTNQCRMIELHDKGDAYDLIVTSGKFSDPDVKTPCIMAISLLTGIGADKTLEQIYQALKD